MRYSFCRLTAETTKFRGSGRYKLFYETTYCTFDWNDKAGFRSINSFRGRCRFAFSSPTMMTLGCVFVGGDRTIIHVPCVFLARLLCTAHWQGVPAPSFGKAHRPYTFHYTKVVRLRLRLGFQVSPMTSVRRYDYTHEQSSHSDISLRYSRWTWTRAEERCNAVTPKAAHAYAHGPSWSFYTPWVNDSLRTAVASSHGCRGGRIGRVLASVDRSHRALL